MAAGRTISCVSVLCLALGSILTEGFPDNLLHRHRLAVVVPAHLACPAPLVNASRPPLKIRASEVKARFDFGCNVSNERPLLFTILVSSKPDDRDLRDAIRDTWAKQLTAFNATLRFFIVLSDNESNSSLAAEHQMFNDTIFAQITLPRAMHPRLHPSVASLAALRWFVRQYSGRVPFLLWTQASTWWDVKRIATRLQSFKGKTVVLGRLKRPAEVQRDNQEPWFTHQTEYPARFFPSYLQGQPGFAISASAARRLLDVAERMPLLWIEDVYVTGLLRRLARVPLAGLSRLIPCRIEPVAFRNYRRMVAVAGMEPEEMRRLWRQKLTRQREHRFEWDCD